MKTIKVLIVDDSIVFRQMLMRHFLNVPNIQIIGYAVDAAEARQKILQLNPDIVESFSRRRDARNERYRFFKEFSS